MTSFCGDSSLELVRDGILPICFIEVILCSLNHVFLLIFGSRRIFELWRNFNQGIRLSLLESIKLGLLALLSFLHLVETSSHLLNGSIFTYVVLSNAIQSLTTIFCLFLCWLEYSRGCRNGWMVRVWMILSFVLQFLAFQSLLHLRKLGNKDEIDIAIQVPVLLISAILASMATFLDKGPHGYDHLDDDGLMEDGENVTHPPKKDGLSEAGILSHLTYQWLWELLKVGYKRPLQLEDLFALPKEFQSKNATEKVEIYWNEQLRNGDPNLWKAVFKGFRSEIWRCFWLKGLTDILAFIPASMLGSIIRFISENRSDNPNAKSTWEGMILVLIITVSSVIWSITINQHFHYAYAIGIQVRTGITNLIYMKAFKLSNKSMNSASVGEMVNLQAVDSHKIQELSPLIHSLWSCPLQILIALLLLYRILGVASIAGLIVMLIIVPLNHKISVKMASFQKIIMGFRDKRIESTNEILNGIRIIKLFAWEDSYIGKVKVSRDGELEQKRRFVNFLGLSAVMWIGSPIIVSFVTFGVYSLLGNELSAEKAFSSLALLALLRNPIGSIPGVISNLLETRLSVNRITKFLISEEKNPKEVNRFPKSEVMKNAIEINNVTWNWDQEILPPVLKDINLSFPSGKLTAVVGSVGSGKSSLLSGMLGDVPKMNGEINIYGEIAYAAQTAWIQNASLRENILFGKEYDRKKYQRVIRVCELEQDLKMLPDGDQTEIGEKGINLSGGQKQRVSLARAVYQDKDIYLLDDPLSAVDAHVGHNIFDHCISGQLSNKTRILVTHQIQHVKHAHWIIVLKEGKVSEIGTYQELMSARGEFFDLITAHVKDDKNEKEEEKNEETKMQLNASRDDIDQLRKSKELVEKKAKRLMTEEARGKGAIKTVLWKFYLNAIGGILLPLITVSLQTSEGLVRVGNDLWLAHWSAESTKEVPSHSNQWFLNVYALIGLGTLILVYGRKVTFQYSALKATASLHNRILSRVMRAPTTFFDTTPVGRILNVFARDVAALDESLPGSLEGAVLNTIHNTITMCIICFIIPAFISLLLPLAYIYRYIAKFYLASTREMKRLDSLTKSPIYAQFSETLSGCNTICSFKEEGTFIGRNFNKTDTNNEAFFAFATSMRWLGFRLDMLGMSVTSFAAAFAIIQRDQMDPGNVGLMLSYCLNLIALFNMLVRNLTDAESQMVSVERVYGYTNIDQESPAKNDYKPPHNWPGEGSIVFNNARAKYREGLSDVLKGISIAIKPREKIGVVGRTGAGKSSLMLTLFRMMELHEGEIFVDGVNIAKLGLDDLRRNLSIIPQDPTLFTGTIRSNLDPFEEHSDMQIWDALDSVKLRGVVESLGNGLEFKISEGGENLSVGSRQLMCLARAILRQAKILVMDEATAAVDFETDSLIQKNNSRKIQ
eukprot:TRINITY_DN1935_c0_g2_i1.p1 TRINITY_DN1935_c0_g2~~TRINITY_DN1935_c0_g2_i1.p1  ORF type:complete len:1401 (-),score=492.82 TRINITY_DN1935_c0_g2_i1:3171-7373(-)